MMYEIDDEIEPYVHLEPEAVMVINSVTKSNILLNEETEGIDMCQAIEEGSKIVSLPNTPFIVFYKWRERVPGL